jgi:hypothetical protein
MGSQNQLILGWKVTNKLDPEYWINSTDPKPGLQAASDLVSVPAASMASHTAIIAQSGSGKSSFLGRIVEEIIIRTRARCVILDPNADFRKIAEVENETLWGQAAYSITDSRGKLPHESSRNDFVSSWSNVSIRIRGGPALKCDKCEPLRLWWPSLDMQFLAEDVDPMYRSDLYHCHSFVKTLGKLLEFKLWSTGISRNLIDSAQRVFRQARGLEKADLRDALEHEYSVAELIGKSLEDYQSEDFVPLGNTALVTRSTIEGTIRGFVESALTVAEYVSGNIERFYFGKAREYQAAGILQTDPTSPSAVDSHLTRIEVVDLPSMHDKGIRLMAINALLTTEWEQAKESWSKALAKPSNEDERVPTFIVVDEAHNLMPHKPRSKAEVALGEQFRTLVAEGRKYGLFLVLVSQRPDKLDPLVVSECENKAIMKLGSPAVLELTKDMLGLDEIYGKVKACLEFGTSRALLTGGWAPREPIILYAAARRTVEGGRSLRDVFWSAGPDPLLKSGKLTERKKAKRNMTRRRSTRIK